MKKGLVILLLSVFAKVSTAQTAVEKAIVVNDAVPVLDSAIFITDLVAALKESSKVVLNWKLINTSASNFVAVERSGNGRDFEVVAVLKQNGASQWYEWVDESPFKGRNAYRIRFAGRYGADQYSKSVSAVLAGDVTSFRFYPNPVDNILIIRTELPVDVQVLDGGGNVRFSQSRVQGLQTINVSSLEKGIYIIRATNKVTGTVIQDRLLKN